jgi:hypothetical protein
MALMAAVGIGQAFFNPALTSLVPSIVKEPHLQSANALIGLFTSTGSVVGPALAVSAVSLSLLELPTPHPFERCSLRARPRSRLAGVLVTQLVVDHRGAVLLLPPVHLPAVPGARRCRIPRRIRRRGILGCDLGVSGSRFGDRWLEMLRWRPRRPLVVVALAAAVGGIGLASFGAPWDTTLQHEIPIDLLSRISAYDWFGSVVSLPLGYALVGPLAAALGVRQTLWFAAGWTLLASAVVMSTRGVRDVTQERPPTAPAI